MGNGEVRRNGRKKVKANTRRHLRDRRADREYQHHTGRKAQRVAVDQAPKGGH